jgi:AFG3 family protein
MAQDNKNMRPGLPPERPGDEKGQKKSPRFSIYWIYALIAVVLIVASYWGKMGPDTTAISEQEFLTMAKEGDVKMIHQVSNKDIVRVFVKPEALNKPAYNNKFKSTQARENAKKAAANDKPLFDFQITSWESFEQRLNQFQKDNNVEVLSKTLNDPDWFGSGLVWPAGKYIRYLIAHRRPLDITHEKNGKSWWWWWSRRYFQYRKIKSAAF